LARVSPLSQRGARGGLDSDSWNFRFNLIRRKPGFVVGARFVFARLAKSLKAVVGATYMSPDHLDKSPLFILSLVRRKDK